MQRVAYAFTDGDPVLPWSEKEHIALYFHAYPHCSVNATHLHIVDLKHAGPTHDHLAFKNLSLNDALEALRAEQESYKASRRITDVIRRVVHLRRRARFAAARERRRRGSEE